MAFCLSWGAFKTVASVVSLNLNLQTMEVQLVRAKSLLLLPSSTDPLWSAHLFEHPGGNTQHKSHAIGIAKSSSNIFDHLGIRLVSSFLDFGAALLISSTAFASFWTFALHLLYSKLLFHLDCSTYDIYIYMDIYDHTWCKCHTFSWPFYLVRTTPTQLQPFAHHQPLASFHEMTAPEGPLDGFAGQGAKGGNCGNW